LRFHGMRCIRISTFGSMGNEENLCVVVAYLLVKQGSQQITTFSLQTMEMFSVLPKATTDWMFLLTCSVTQNPYDFFLRNWTFPATLRPHYWKRRRPACISTGGRTHNVTFHTLRSGHPPLMRKNFCGSWGNPHRPSKGPPNGRVRRIDVLPAYAAGAAPLTSPGFAPDVDPQTLSVLAFVIV
jgi:hypothetical protein